MSKISLFTNFTATGSRTPLFDLTLEFFARIKNFIFVWNLITQQRLPLNHGACLSYWRVFVSGSFNK